METHSTKCLQWINYVMSKLWSITQCENTEVIERTLGCIRKTVKSTVYSMLLLVEKRETVRKTCIRLFAHEETQVGYIVN